ncbi:hypothetical protein FACS1894198_0440 [Clostridia bacterium]|nr:hypothetical protein FACS1894198_0440 [Clostridia bacterium]
MRKVVYKAAVVTTSALVLLSLVCSNGISYYFKAQNRKQDVSQSFAPKNKPTVRNKHRKTKGGKHVHERNTDTAQDFAPKNELTAEHDGWRLILVNRDHPVADDYIDNVTLKTIREGKTPLKVDERIFDDLKQMLEDAKSDGIDLLVCSAYRSFQTQRLLFDRYVKGNMNAGMTREKAEQEIVLWCAKPGTSEHHTGLAVDIVTPPHQGLDEGFGKTAAYRWLSANCTKYGCIERYIKSKFKITHVKPEPWHYRYVGKDLAPLIKASGLCYEEYFERYIAAIFRAIEKSEKTEHTQQLS